MLERRNIFLHGLTITLRRLPALLWTYVFNLGLALVFSIRLHRQFSAMMDHSLGAQRLVSGFDLGTVGESVLRLQDGPSGGSATAYAAIPLYLVIYLVLVPGTIFAYLSDTRARLSTLLQQGLLFFWRFTRIALLTVLVSVVILGPLLFLQNRWSEHIDEHTIGRTAFLYALAGNVSMFLFASILRLYFDLVEVYTVQLGQSLRPDGRPDRRVRRALGPAFRSLAAHFSQAWPIFLFLTLFGIAAVILTARTSMHMLAQPRVWPTFLIAQIGLFLMLFARFWQRGVETSLAIQNPILNPIEPMIEPTIEPERRIQLTSEPHKHTTLPEPISNPEPAAPSLDHPDSGVFHRDPGEPFV
jgi:hypothetical protein